MIDMKPAKKPYQGLAWWSTGAVLLAAALAAYNVYPLYVFMFTVSSIMWTVVGYLWNEKSIMILNAILTLIYILGLIGG